MTPENSTIEISVERYVELTMQPLEDRQALHEQEAARDRAEVKAAIAGLTIEMTKLTTTAAETRGSLRFLDRFWIALAASSAVAATVIAALH